MKAMTGLGRRGRVNEPLHDTPRVVRGFNVIHEAAHAFTYLNVGARDGLDAA